MDKITHEVRCKQWTSIINECLASGMTKTAWCRANGISDKQFFYWQRILRKEAYIEMASSSKDLPSVPGPDTTLAEIQKPSFVEVKPPIGEPSQRRFHPDLVVRSGNLTIEISNTVSSELLSLLGGLLHA